MYDFNSSILLSKLFIDLSDEALEIKYIPIGNLVWDIILGIYILNTT